MLTELPFYDELNLLKRAKGFKKQARRYSIEIIKDKEGNMNDPQLSQNLVKQLLKTCLEI